jgi:sterol desaturase/sphingolipid hydroxylase (fatty acid hydroxylase superfamily)
MTFIAHHEPALRMAGFLSGAVIFTAFETMRPRQSKQADRPKRWMVNYAMTIINAGLLRFAFPLLAVETAIYASDQRIGLFHQLGVPALIAGVIGILALDAIVYWQHRLFHRLPLLWRLHRMHHSDTSIDVSTALRFHPIEIALSMLIKITAVVALGVPAFAVILFEIILNFSAMFNHANWDLGRPLDRWLVRFLVTPDMHRIHHSIYNNEMHSNFGFSLSIWDRLFGSYRADPKDQHESMTIGLRQWRRPDDQRLGRLLLQPFLTESADKGRSVEKQSLGF